MTPPRLSPPSRWEIEPPQGTGLPLVSPNWSRHPKRRNDPLHARPRRGLWMPANDALPADSDGQGGSDVQPLRPAFHPRLWPTTAAPDTATRPLAKVGHGPRQAAAMKGFLLVAKRAGLRERFYAFSRGVAGCDRASANERNSSSMGPLRRRYDGFSTHVNVGFRDADLAARRAGFESVMVELKPG